MPKSFLCCCALLLLLSCKPAENSSSAFFDSLVNDQIKNLSSAKASLNKHARMGYQEDETTFTPSAAEWDNELDIFRQLDAFEKPAYRASYEITAGLKDRGSNLSIKIYRASKKVPVPELKFYYLRDLHDLKRIEAQYQEQNSLFTGKRKLVLEFETINGATHLSGYSMNGLQKMVLADSVLFSVTGSIRY